MKEYSVFVGGTEVNDYYLTLKEARKLAYDYEVEQGYQDVFVLKMEVR
jgi:hypothetical protein